MQLEALFDRPLPSSHTEFTRAQTTEIHAEILSRVAEGSLPRWVGHRLPPFCRVVACPENLLKVHCEMFKTYLQKYREGGEEDTRLQLMCSFAVIFHTDKGGETYDMLSERERIDLGDVWVVPMMELAHVGEEFPRYALLQLFLSTTFHYQEYLVRKFERLRTKANLPTSVYTQCYENTRFRNILAEINTSVH